MKNNIMIRLLSLNNNIEIKNKDNIIALLEWFYDRNYELVLTKTVKGKRYFIKLSKEDKEEAKSILIETRKIYLILLKSISTKTNNAKKFLITPDEIENESKRACAVYREYVKIKTFLEFVL